MSEQGFKFIDRRGEDSERKKEDAVQVPEEQPRLPASLELPGVEGTVKGIIKRVVVPMISDAVNKQISAINNLAAGVKTTGENLEKAREAINSIATATDTQHKELSQVAHNAQALVMVLMRIIVSHGLASYEEILELYNVFGDLESEGEVAQLFLRGAPLDQITKGDGNGQ